MKEGVENLEIGEKRASFLVSGDIKAPKETYRILGFWLTYLITIILIVISFTFLTLGIIDIVVYGKFNIHDFLAPVALMIIACVITYYFPFYSSITVDFANREVICRKYKLFFFVKKIVKIDTRNVEKVYTEKNLTEGYGNDESNPIYTFNLVFQMNNGDKILGLEGEVDNDNEMIKVGFFMSKFFPGFLEQKGDNPELIPKAKKDKRNNKKNDKKNDNIIDNKIDDNNAINDINYDDDINTTLKIEN